MHCGTLDCNSSQVGMVTLSSPSNMFTSAAGGLNPTWVKMPYLIMQVFSWRKKITQGSPLTSDITFLHCFLGCLHCEGFKYSVITGMVILIEEDSQVFCTKNNNPQILNRGSIKFLPLNSHVFLRFGITNYSSNLEQILSQSSSA